MKLSRRTSNGMHRVARGGSFSPAAPLLTNTLLMQQFAQRQHSSDTHAVLQPTGLQSLLDRLQRLGLTHKGSHTLTKGIFSETSVLEGIDPFGTMVGKVTPLLLWPAIKASCSQQTRITDNNNNNNNNNYSANNIRCSSENATMARHDTDAVMVASQ